MANNRRRLTGRVVSDKMDKTVTVLLERRTMHRVYKKVVASSRKVLAHDESNSVPVGATVRVVESRPLSRRKRWVVEEVLSTPDLIEMSETVGAVTIEPDQSEADETPSEPEIVEEAEA
jgi:small subunit ribosomal protein S17